MENKKYEILPGNTITEMGDKGEIRLYRIRALQDIHLHDGIIHAGELGGYIQHEDNLSVSDISWIYPGSKVCDNARVEQFAKVDNSLIKGDVLITNQATVRDARVAENAVIKDRAYIGKGASIRGHAIIADKASIWGPVLIKDHAIIKNNAKVHADQTAIHVQAMIFGHALIQDEAIIHAGLIKNYACISGNACINNGVITDYAQIHDAIIDGNGTHIGKNACICGHQLIQKDRSMRESRIYVYAGIYENTRIIAYIEHTQKTPKWLNIILTDDPLDQPGEPYGFMCLSNILNDLPITENHGLVWRENIKRIVNDIYQRYAPKYQKKRDREILYLNQTADLLAERTSGGCSCKA